MEYVEKCGKCGEYSTSAYWRAEFRQVLCASCYRDALRRVTPTKLMKTVRKERIAWMTTMSNSTS